MSKLLIYFLDKCAIGINRFTDFVKTLGGGDSEMTLTEVLIISRVLFAIVMIGFIGYFFDHIKHALFPVQSDANEDSRRER
jgi:hypothetical protein